MKLCAQTMTVFNRMSERDGLELFKSVGFDCLDYSMFQSVAGEFMNQPLEDMLAYYRDLRAMADEIGIPFGQMHAPFIPAEGSKPDSLKPYVLRAIDACGILGAGNLVVHHNHSRIGMFFSEDEILSSTFDYYRQFIPRALERGVTICVENLPYYADKNRRFIPSPLSTPGGMNLLIDRLNDFAGEQRFKACLDIGHAALLDDSAPSMVRRLSRNLGCLHVQDNDFAHDSHIMPFYGKTNVIGVCKALRDMGYDGAFTFECEESILCFPTALLPDALRLLHSVGRYLISIVEGKAEP